MKYALLIYGSDGIRDGLSDEESAAVTDEYEALFAAPGVLGGLRLLPNASTTTVRVDDGETLLTDGPFIDAKEYLGGFYLLEADDLDAATALASRIPAARMGGAIEVRPVMESRL
jgi:hypothetical protein